VNAVFQGVLANIVLIVVVVFQSDIRRGLQRVGQTAWFASRRNQQTRVIDEVVAAATELARHRTGAIIAFEQEANLLEFTKHEGIALDATVTRELLVALFVPEPENKLHDGAIILRDYRLARAGVFFPMPEGRNIDASFGTRHRASLGITEETDAVVVVVSEERGTISLCVGGNLILNLDDDALRNALVEHLGPKKPVKKKAPRKEARPKDAKKKDKEREKDEAAQGEGEPDAPRSPPTAPRVNTPPSGLPKAEAPMPRVNTPAGGLPRADLGRITMRSEQRSKVPDPPPSEEETEPPPSKLVPLKIEVGTKLEERNEPKVEVGQRLEPDRTTEPPPSGVAGEDRPTHPSLERARPSLELPPTRGSSVPMPEANLSMTAEDQAGEEP